MIRAAEQQSEANQEKRRTFSEWQANVDIGRVFAIDEAGSHIAMTPNYAWAPRGERARDAVPRNRGTVVTMLAALSIDGLCAMMTVEGGTSGDVFLAYSENVLLPELRPGDVVLLDNVGAHRDRRVQEAFERAGVELCYLPPYSPDLNPIELAWAKVKWFLRLAKARTREALDTAVAFAMNMISEDEARRWFGHCGFNISQTG